MLTIEERKYCSSISESLKGIAGSLEVIDKCLTKICDYYGR